MKRFDVTSTDLFDYAVETFHFTLGCAVSIGVAYFLRWQHVLNSQDYFMLVMLIVIACLTILGFFALLTLLAWFGLFPLFDFIRTKNRDRKARRELEP